VGDGVKAAGGRVWAVGLDDRAVCLGGRAADGVLAFDPPTGAFRSVGRPDPGWLGGLNSKKPADRWFGTAWERLRPGPMYDALLGPDGPAGKGTGAGQGVSFPHPFGVNADGPNFRAAVQHSPAGNELTWEAAKAVMDGEQLGRQGQTDLLLVGLTATGRVMQAWGPDSHEAADALVRADKLTAEVLNHLALTCGNGRWTLMVVGCHGGCPLPEAARPGRPAGSRFDPQAEFGALGAAFDEVYGKVPGGWVDRVAFPWVDLNRAALSARRADPLAAAAFAAQWLENRPAALMAVPRGATPDDPVGRAVARGMHADRGGDVFVVAKPYAVPVPAGTAAGSPHPYDRTASLLAVGSGVPVLKTQPTPVGLTVAASILAKLLDVPPPAGAEEPLPPGFAD
jgi:hypothetical protein